MKCLRCGSERIYCFEAGPRIREDVEAELPRACRDCGLVTVGGVAVPLPAELEHSARTLAEAAAEHGEETAAEIMNQDPTQVRVGKYFGRVYAAGYVDGAVRAWAYRMHEAKQGRLVRLRKLWKEGFCLEYEKKSGHHEVILIADKAAYTEFVRLLQLGDHHGQSSENQHSPPEESSSRLP